MNYSLSYLADDLKIVVSLLRGKEYLINQLNELGPIRVKQLEESLLQCLKWNRLTPYFYSTITPDKFEHFFSEEFILSLKNEYRESVFRTMQIEGVFRELISLLHRNQIDIVVLKGVHLSQQVYPEPSHRPMGDIDILVNKKDVNKTRDLLIKSGGTPAYITESKHTDGLWQHIPPIVYKGIPIEIHHQLFTSYDKHLLPAERVFRHAIPVKINNLQYLVPAPEHLFFYLIHHLHKHAESGYIRLIWILDIKLLWEHFKGIVDNKNFDALVNQKSGYYLKVLGAIQAITQIDLASIQKDSDSSEVESIARHYLSICNKESKSILRVGSINSITGIKSVRGKLLFIAGKLFPTLAFVKSKYKIKFKVLIPFFYLSIYIRYIQKIWKVAKDNLLSSSR